MFELIETEGQLTKYIIKESLEDGNRFIKSDLIKHIEPLEKEIEKEKNFVVAHFIDQYSKIVGAVLDDTEIVKSNVNFDDILSKTISALNYTNLEKGILHAIRQSDKKSYKNYLNKILLDNISAIVNGCYYEGV